MDMIYKFYVPEGESKNAHQYLLKLFAKSQGLIVKLTDNTEDATFVELRSSFLNLASTKEIKIQDDRGVLQFNNKPDYLATAFYMLNCLQEYQGQPLDSLGRYPYSSSYQYRLGNIQDNIVQYCFDQLAVEYRIKGIKKKTQFFLTHDIDSVYGSILEDGFNVLKKGRFDIFFQMLFRVAMGRPDWLNMDKIIKLESEYDCKSVFYWIVNKGRINKREVNADYKFHSKTIQSQLELVQRKGFENGLHKSISGDNFQDEISKFKVRPTGNRYHYLKFNLPDGFDAIEQAGLKLDASLGFAEEFGFRNSYGLPFVPYNLKTDAPYSFVEVPLHIMDATFFSYQKKSPIEAGREIIAFFERNCENCVLSILWHNNFFTNYKFKGYLELYKSILSYIKDNNFSTISQQEIIDQHSL